MIISHQIFHQKSNKNRANCQNGTNVGALKFKDLADFKPALIMCKLKDNLLPENILRLFKVRDGQYWSQKDLYAFKKKRKRLLKV